MFCNKFICFANNTMNNISISSLVPILANECDSFNDILFFLTSLSCSYSKLGVEPPPALSPPPQKMSKSKRFSPPVYLLFYFPQL